MPIDYHNMQPLADKNWTNQANATSLLQAKLFRPPVASNTSSCVQKNAKDENPILQMRMYMGPFRPFQAEITSVRMLECIFGLYNNSNSNYVIQTQMAQKPMLRAEVYAHAMRASQNRKKEVRRKSSYVLTVPTAPYYKL